MTGAIKLSFVDSLTKALLYLQISSPVYLLIIVIMSYVVLLAPTG